MMLDRLGDRRKRAAATRVVTTRRRAKSQAVGVIDLMNDKEIPKSIIPKKTRELLERYKQ